MKKTLAALVATISLAGAARADGASLFATKCAMCHGKDGKGAPMGVKMGAKDLAGAAGSEADLAKVIAGGKGKMLAFKGKLTDDEIAGLARFIKAGLK